MNDAEKNWNLRHVGIFIVRLIITFAFFAFILTKIDLRNAFEAVTRIGVWSFVGQTLLLFLNTTMIGPRWQKVLECYGINLSLFPLLRIATEGYFFNQVLPTSIGGDAVRIWGLRRRGVALNPAARSVIVDRLFGLGTLFLFVVVGLPFVLAESAAHDLIRPFLIILALALLAGLGFLVALQLRGRSGFLRHLQFVFDFAHELKEMVLAPSVAAPCLIYSIIGNLFPIIAVAWIAMPLGTNLSLADYFEIVPAALLLSVLPVSIAGWGVREAAMVVCMGEKGVSPDMAVVISVVFGIAMTLSALPGGVLWFIGWRAAPNFVSSRMAIGEKIPKFGINRASNRG